MNKNPLKIGVVLFAFNRPEHTRQVVKSLKANAIERLYVFCDAPKDGFVNDSIHETRKLLQQIDWCELIFHYPDKHLGLVGNVVSGINSVLGENDAVIVVEDDCVVRPDFYRFMSVCLNFYRDNLNVFHVNGCQYPIPVIEKPPYDVYFSPVAISWGYGFWKRSWTYFCMDVNDAAEFFRSDASKVVRDVMPNFSYNMQDLIKGRVNSWVYRWLYLIAKNGGWCISPYRTYVHNIGWDQSGENCRNSVRAEVIREHWERPVLSCADQLRLPNQIHRNAYMDRQTRKYFPTSPTRRLAKETMYRVKEIFQ